MIKQDALTIRDLRAEEVEVRVGSVNKNGASFLLYKDARCDMNILDETFGVMGWQREHNIKNGKEFCTISVFDTFYKQWVKKEDTGTESYTEKEKGQSSDAFKRAAFNIGIGRELYSSPFIFIKLPTKESNGKWTLAEYPSLKVTELEVKQKKITKVVIANLKTGEQYTFPAETKPKTEKNEAKNDINVDEYPLPKCSSCGRDIIGSGGYTPQRVAEITKQKTGKQLCTECYKKVVAMNG